MANDESIDSNTPETPISTDDGTMVYKKLSTASIIPASMLVPPASGVTWLYRLGGRAVSTVTGESTYGTWVALLGEFFATTFHDGCLHTSPKCFLPANVGELIASQLSVNDTNKVQAIDFVYDIGITANRREPTKKYDYVVRKPDGTETRRNQVVAMMRGLALPKGVTLHNSNQPQLPGM